MKQRMAIACCGSRHRKHCRTNAITPRRADHQHRAIHWEFPPTAKVEAGESVFAALQHEIREEVALMSRC
ncbi:MAG: hypothetical protein R3E67_01045 [Pseudomonadales bacterium]